VTDYLILFAIVFAINLLPAFGPPTWSIIVLLGVSMDLPLPGLVLTAAVASSSGRYLLARAFRLFASHLSERMRANLAAARAAFERRRHNHWLALVFFAVSPLPSAQQFGAVGLAGVRLLPITLAFFAGRLVSYTVYAGSAQLVVEHTSMGEAFRDMLTSPLGIAVQMVMLAGLVALARIDWAKLLQPPPDDDEPG